MNNPIIDKPDKVNYDRKEISEVLRPCGPVLCPKCSIDSVIGDASGIPIRENVLEDLYQEIALNHLSSHFHKGIISISFPLEVLWIRSSSYVTMTIRSKG